MSREKIIIHQGWPEHLIVVTSKEKNPALCYVQKSSRVSVQWRPDPKEFRLLGAVGIVASVRYVLPQGAEKPVKLLDVQVCGGRILSINENALTKLIPIDIVLGRTSV